MSQQLVECVPNFSEGRSKEVNTSFFFLLVENFMFAYMPSVLSRSSMRSRMPSLKRLVVIYWTWTQARRRTALCTRLWASRTM